MIRKLLLTTTAFVALSGVALAADLPSRVAAPMYAPPVFTWTGFYVGASAGYLRAKTDFTDVNGDGTSSGAVIGNSSDGGIFGLNAGYNFQLAGPLVLGLEADIALATNSHTTDLYADGQYLYQSKISSLGTVRGRLGFAWDRALLYVTGGYAYGNVKNGFDYTPQTVYSAGTSSWQSGWVAGAGIEYAMTPNWTVRAEGLYADLGKKSAVAPYTGQTYAFDFKTTALIARVGVNYKF